MSRQAYSCAVLLLVVTLPSQAADSKPDSAATADSWAPLPPASSSASAPSANQTKLEKAEDKKKATALNQAPAGYHDVKLKGGGVVRVADQAKPTMKNNANNGPYDPENADFSRTSSYANKSFSPDSAQLSRDFSDDKKNYSTKGFPTSIFNHGDQVFQTSAYRGTKEDSEFAKSYVLPNPADTNKTFATKSSYLQGKSSTIAANPASTDPFAKPWSEGDKRFYDPTMLHVPHHHFELSSSIRNDPNSDTITDIPNRPLTVDEVRNLINNGQVPDTNSKPGAPSRALNDPDWEPPLKLPEISDRAAPATPPPDEARDNELPSPGMMAQPRPGK